MLVSVLLAFATSLSPPPSFEDPWYVFFLKGSAVVGDREEVLKNAVLYGREKNGLCLRLVGHADAAEGVEATKLALSKARADNVRRWLLMAVPDGKITVDAASDRAPLVRAGGPQNQRVSLTFCN